jgi:hypothetical protein
MSTRSGIIDVERLAAAPEEEVARTLVELFGVEPARAYDALAPALDPARTASRPGAALAAEVLAWLSGDSAGARQSVDRRPRRAQSRQSQTDRYEELESDAWREAKRHWQGEPRWRADVLALAKSGTLSTDPLWRLTGLAALELSDDESWSVLDPLLTPAVLAKRGGAEFALESLLSNPWRVAPDLEHRHGARLASPRVVGRLAELARSKSLSVAAERLLLDAVDGAMKATDGRAFEAGAAVLAEGGPLAGRLVSHLHGNELAAAALARDPRWLGLLSAKKSHIPGGLADLVIEETLVRILALPPSGSFEALEPIAGTGAQLLSAVKALGQEGIARLVEAEPRWATRLLACTADPKLADEVPVYSLLPGLFTHDPAIVFAVLSPLLATPAGRKRSSLASEVAQFIDLSLGGFREDAGQRVLDHLEREPRWLDVVLSWSESAGPLEFERALQLLVKKSTLSAEELFAKLARFIPASRLKEQEAERAAAILHALADEPRLDHPIFLDRFAACLAANPKRAWILDGAAARLVARGDARVVPSLLVMLGGMSIPTTLPEMLRSMRDPRIPPAVVGVLSNMPPTLLAPLHDVLRAHGDASVIPALEKIAKGRGKAATLAKETCVALAPGRHV